MVTSVPIRGNDRNISRNVNTAPHPNHDHKFGHEAVSEGTVVCLVFIFLGGYIRKNTLPETCLTRANMVGTASWTAFSSICR